jgi:hypothetical protein
MFQAIRKLFGGSGHALSAYKSSEEIRRKLAELPSIRYVELLELLIQDGFTGGSGGVLTATEKEQFLQSVEQLKAGRAVDARDFPDVSDPRARRRIARWLTNISRSDVSCCPHDLSELGAISLWADAQTMQRIRRVYDLYHPKAGTERVVDLGEMQRRKSATFWGQLAPCIGNRVLIISKQPLFMEEASIIPNLVLTFLLDPLLTLIHVPNRDMVMFRKLALEGQPVIDEFSLQRASMTLQARGGRLEEFVFA